MWLYFSAGLSGADYVPEILSRARTARRQASSRAALSTRISCVLGSTRRQTIAQTAAMSDIRRTNDRRSLNIAILYPI